MRSLILSILFFSAVGYCHGQKMPDVNLSRVHVTKIENSSSIKEKLKLYRKFYKKDSAHLAKQFEKLLQFKSDSLMAAMQQRDLILSGQKLSKRDLRKLDRIREKFNLPEYTSITLPDSAAIAGKLERMARDQFEMDVPLDSGDLRKQGLSIIKEKIENSNMKEVNELENLADKYQDDLSKYREKLGILKSDSLLKDELKNEAVQLAQEKAGRINEFKAIEDYKKQVASLDPSQNEYKKKLDQLQDSAYIKEHVKKEAEEMAMRYISENPAMMKAAKTKTDWLMKKYSIVPNSNDLSTAVKRTSLEGKSFKERLYISGNFQILSLKPFAFDFSPMIGYRFNTRLTAGLGGNYRKTFGDSLATVSADMFGYKAFVSYDVFRNFFAYSEFANNSSGMVQSENELKRNWEYAFLIGIGRKFTLHPKVEMTVVMLYNATRKPGDAIYPSPWVMRVGFQLSELALRKKLPSYRL